MASSGSKKKLALRFVVPPELEQGVYATIAHVHGTEFDHTITFYHPITPAHLERPVALEARAVARVTIPRGVMDSFINALQEHRRKINEAEAAGTSEE